MKEVLLQIEDSAYVKFMGMVSLCPQVKVLSEGVAIETRGTTDLCVARAIRDLRADGVFRYPCDYTYLMLAANEGLAKGMAFFCSPKDFIDYLKELELDGLPGRSTLYDTLSKVEGKYPDWTFKDNPKPKEVLRRKNVVKLFLSAFGKARRTASDGMSDNRP
jgi:hypothetical protein